MPGLPSNGRVARPHEYMYMPVQLPWSNPPLLLKHPFYSYVHALCPHKVLEVVERVARECVCLGCVSESWVVGSCHLPRNTDAEAFIKSLPHTDLIERHGGAPLVVEWVMRKRQGDQTFNSPPEPSVQVFLQTSCLLPYFRRSTQQVRCPWLKTTCTNLPRKRSCAGPGTRGVTR